MVTAKQAIAAAFQAFADLYDERPQDLRLEEVSRTDDGIWRITLGFSVEKFESAHALLRSVLPEKKYERVYKTFLIDAETGEFLSMSIRLP